MKQKFVIDKSYLKRRKGESLVFDVYINTINIISIESNKGNSNLKIEPRNRVIFKLPAYIRKKSKIIFTSLSKCKNISQYNYNSITKKDINSNIEAENQNNTLKKQIKEDEIDIASTNQQDIIIKEENDDEQLIISDNIIYNNDGFKELVKNPIPINQDDIQKIKILGDGNCLYRCLSLFLLGNDKFYENIKQEIINWIDNNREKFNDFFGDDEIKNITKEQFAEEEYNYIKKKIHGGFSHNRNSLYNF